MELTFRNILLNEDNWQASFSDEDLPDWMFDKDEDDHTGESPVYNVTNKEEDDIIDRFIHRKNAEKYLADLKEKDPEIFDGYEVEEEWVTDEDWHRMDEKGWLKDSLR